MNTTKSHLLPYYSIPSEWGKGSQPTNYEECHGLFYWWCSSCPSSVPSRMLSGNQGRIRAFLLLGSSFHISVVHVSVLYNERPYC